MRFSPFCRHLQLAAVAWQALQMPDVFAVIPFALDIDDGGTTREIAQSRGVGTSVVKR